MDLVRLPPGLAKASAVASLAAAVLAVLAVPRAAWEVQLAVLSFGFLCAIASSLLGVRIDYQGYYEPAEFARGPRVSFERLRGRILAYLVGALVVAVVGAAVMAGIGRAMWVSAPGQMGAVVALLFLVFVGLFAAMDGKAAATAREIEIFGE